MGLLDIFNYGTGGSYYADQQKEIDKKYKTFPVAGGKVDMTIDRRTQNITGGSLPNQLPSGMQVPKSTQKPFHPSQGGIFNKDGTTLGKGDVSKDNLNFFSKLTGLNFKQLQGDFKKEGGFDALMANPAFTLGLAIMQSLAQGKRIDSALMDNFVQAAGLSAAFKDRMDARKQAPIQATAADIEEVKGVLSTLKIKEPNMWEKVGSWFKGEDGQANFDRAAEAVAIEYQKEVARLQKANKSGKPLVIDSEFKERIIRKLIKSCKVKHTKGILGGRFTAGTISKQPVPMAKGGPIKAGKPYIVGEQGPEVIIPNASGNVLSNDNSQIFAMLLAANPQLQNVSRTRSEKILKSRFPEYFE